MHPIMSLSPGPLHIHVRPSSVFSFASPSSILFRIIAQFSISRH